MGKSKDNEKWEADLKDYLELVNYLGTAPSSHSSDVDEKRLAIWMEHNKFIYKLGTLDKDRVKALEKAIPTIFTEIVSRAVRWSINNGHLESMGKELVDIGILNKDIRELMQLGISSIDDIAYEIREGMGRGKETITLTSIYKTLGIDAENMYRSNKYKTLQNIILKQLLEVDVLDETMIESLRLVEKAYGMEGIHRVIKYNVGEEKVNEFIDRVDISVNSLQPELRQIIRNKVMRKLTLEQLKELTNLSSGQISRLEVRGLSEIRNLRVQSFIIGD